MSNGQPELRGVMMNDVPDWAKEIVAQMSKDHQEERFNSCNFCGQPGDLDGSGPKNLKTCSRCRKVFYCNERCQRGDWKDHKKSCKSLAKIKGTPTPSIITDELLTKQMNEFLKIHDMPFIQAIMQKLLVPKLDCTSHCIILHAAYKPPSAAPPAGRFPISDGHVFTFAEAKQHISRFLKKVDPLSLGFLNEFVEDGFELHRDRLLECNKKGKGNHVGLIFLLVDNGFEKKAGLPFAHIEPFTFGLHQIKDGTYEQGMEIAASLSDMDCFEMIKILTTDGLNLNKFHNIMPVDACG